MRAPDLRDLVHDLRNAMGIVRALALDLESVATIEPENVPDALEEVDRFSRYALETLRVVEHHASDESLRVHLGAWAWTLRLWARALRIEDLSRAMDVRVAVRPSLEAGLGLIEALHAQHAVLVACDAATGAVMFTVSTSAHDETQVERAMGALREAGFACEWESRMPCSVRVSALEPVREPDADA